MLIELVMVVACAWFCLEGLAVALVWVSVLLVLVGGLTVSLGVAFVWGVGVGVGIRTILCIVRDPGIVMRVGIGVGLGLLCYGCWSSVLDVTCILVGVSAAALLCVVLVVVWLGVLVMCLSLRCMLMLRFMARWPNGAPRWAHGINIAGLRAPRKVHVIYLLHCESKASVLYHIPLMRPWPTVALGVASAILLGARADGGVDQGLDVNEFTASHILFASSTALNCPARNPDTWVSYRADPLPRS